MYTEPIIWTFDTYKEASDKFHKLVTETADLLSVLSNDYVVVSLLRNIEIVKVMTMIAGDGRPDSNPLESLKHITHA